MTDHRLCERIRMCLAEGGLDPSRMVCITDGFCAVNCGTGDEGFTYEQVAAITNKAIKIANSVSERERERERAMTDDTFTRGEDPQFLRLVAEEVEDADFDMAADLRAAADRIEALTAELAAERALADQLATAIGMSVSASTAGERVVAYHRKTNATRAALEAWRARRSPKEPT